MLWGQILDGLDGRTLNYIMKQGFLIVRSNRRDEIGFSFEGTTFDGVRVGTRFIVVGYATWKEFVQQCNALEPGSSVNSFGPLQGEYLLKIMPEDDYDNMIFDNLRRTE